MKPKTSKALPTVGHLYGVQNGGRPNLIMGCLTRKTRRTIEENSRVKKRRCRVEKV